MGWDNNRAAWHALGKEIGTDAVSPTPSRRASLTTEDSSSACVDCGELDIFRDESVAGTARLWAAGVFCQLHIRLGSAHGFDRVPVETGVATGAWTDRLRVINNL